MLKLFITFILMNLIFSQNSLELRFAYSNNSASKNYLFEVSQNEYSDNFSPSIKYNFVHFDIDYMSITYIYSDLNITNQNLTNQEYNGINKITSLETYEINYFLQFYEHLYINFGLNGNYLTKSGEDFLGLGYQIGAEYPIYKNFKVYTSITFPIIREIKQWHIGLSYPVL